MSTGEVELAKDLGLVNPQIAEQVRFHKDDEWELLLKGFEKSDYESVKTFIREAALREAVDACSCEEPFGCPNDGIEQRFISERQLEEHQCPVEYQ